jgi:RNA polymerase sigma-70 factor, ECF subfamily
VKSDHVAQTGSPAPLPGGLPGAPEERALVHAILHKDRKAAAQFVAAHVDGIYSYVRHRLTPCADLVDDLVQDVFLSALTHLASYQGSSSLRSWLLGIARHKVEDFYRMRLRSPDSLDDLQAVGEEPVLRDPLPDELLDDERTRTKTRAILVRLPERYALLLLWRYWEQRSIREIASTTGATEKGVERALARARSRFKQLWMEG